jgi:hypothetical protein
VRRGWVAVSRDESQRLMEIFPPKTRLNARSVWFEMLLRAQYSDGQYNGRPIRRGQFPFGQAELARACGLSRRQVKTVLNRLEEGSVLHIKADNHGSMATILNFDTYSPPFQAEGQRNGQQRDSKSTAKGHTEQKQEQKQQVQSTTYGKRKDLKKPTSLAKERRPLENVIREKACEFGAI